MSLETTYNNAFTRNGEKLMFVGCDLCILSILSVFCYQWSNVCHHKMIEGSIKRKPKLGFELCMLSKGIVKLTHFLLWWHVHIIFHWQKFPLNLEETFGEKVFSLHKLHEVALVQEAIMAIFTKIKIYVQYFLIKFPEHSGDTKFIAHYACNRSNNFFRSELLIL